MTRSELSRRRRTVLKGLGVAGTVGVGAVASAAADGPGRGADRGELRLLGEAETPGARQVTTQGRYAYVANNKTNDVSVIDVASLWEVERHRVGIHPDGIGYVPG